MPTPRRRSPAFKLAVALLLPPLTVFTRREWHGAEHLPRDRGFVVVTNHISYADPLTLAHFLYRNGCPPRFLAKESLFRLPVGGRILAGAGQIPVYRETATAGLAYRAAVAAVEAGECVAIYPEATITRDPGLWPMVGKTGAARVALLTGCPVIPVVQWGPQEILAPYHRRVHLVPPRRVQVHAGEPVDLSAYAGRDLNGSTLRAATETILDRLTVMLAQVRAEPAPDRRWNPAEHGQRRIGNYKRGGEDPA